MLVYTRASAQDAPPRQRGCRLAILLLLAGVALCGLAVKMATVNPVGEATGAVTSHDAEPCASGVRSGVEWVMLLIEGLVDARVYEHAGAEKTHDDGLRPAYIGPPATTHGVERGRCSAHQE